MKKLLLILLVVLTLNVKTSGQDHVLSRQISQLIDSAKNALCKNDTIKAVKLLEKIEQLYPTDMAILCTNQVLAELYIAAGRVDEAKNKLLYAFYYSPVNNTVYTKTETCNTALSDFSFPRAKADLCVSLSRFYLNQQQFDSSLYFLNLADGDFLPYRNCGNGMISYRSYLSTCFADYYLSVSDTTKAIRRLMDFLLKTDGNTTLLTQKLKTILLSKWTQSEISQEIDKGLKKLKFSKGDQDDEIVISFTMFGYTINERGYGKRKVYRDLYLKHPGLQILYENE
jgi:tetratricopeptide (TPR) repeat protein